VSELAPLLENVQQCWGGGCKLKKNVKENVGGFNCGERKEWVNLLMGRNWVIGVLLPPTPSPLCVCVCVCIHTYRHTHTHTHTHTRNNTVNCS